MLHTAFLIGHALLKQDYTWSFEPAAWLALAIGVYFRMRFVRHFLLIVSPIYMVAAIVVPTLWAFGRFDVTWRIGATLYPTPSAWFVFGYAAALFFAFAYPWIVLVPRRVGARFAFADPIDSIQ